MGVPPRGCRIRGAYISPSLLSFVIRVVRGMGFEFATLRHAMAHPQGKWAVLTFDDGYDDTHAVALPLLRSLGVPATTFIISGDVGRDGLVWPEAKERLPANLMCWHAIAELAHAGWEIGSHGHAHVHLDRYGAPEQRELVLQSLSAIESRVGVRPTTLAYPYGSYNRATLEVLSSLGVHHAVTTAPTRRGKPTVKSSPLELTRVTAGGGKLRHYLKTARHLAQAVGPALFFKGLWSAVGLPRSPALHLQAAFRGRASHAGHAVQRYAGRAALLLARRPLWSGLGLRTWSLATLALVLLATSEGPRFAHSHAVAPSRGAVAGSPQRGLGRASEQVRPRLREKLRLEITPDGGLADLSVPDLRRLLTALDSVRLLPSPDPDGADRPPTRW